MTGGVLDRRISRRRRLAEIPLITEIRARSETLNVVNVSRGGILIETGVRWLPGTSSLLEILRMDGSLRLRAEVVRCCVTAVSADMLRFRVGIAFNRELDFIEDEDVLDELTSDLSLPSGPLRPSGESLQEEDLQITLASRLDAVRKLSVRSVLVENGW